MAGDDAEAAVVGTQFRLPGATGLTAQADGNLAQAARRPHLAQQMANVEQLMVAANPAPGR